MAGPAVVLKYSGDREVIRVLSGNLRDCSHALHRALLIGVVAALATLMLELDGGGPFEKVGALPLFGIRVTALPLECIAILVCFMSGLATSWLAGRMCVVFDSLGEQSDAVRAAARTMPSIATMESALWRITVLLVAPAVITGVMLRSTLQYSPGDHPWIGFLAMAALFFGPYLSAEVWFRSTRLRPKT